MAQWNDEDLPPWYWMAGRFDTVIIEDGVENIGSYAFNSCDLQSVTIPASVTSIGEAVFCWVETVRYGGNMLVWYQMQEDTYWYSELLCDNTTVTDSCGADLMYTMDFASGALTITGTGAMPRWKEESDVPWVSFRDLIHTVVLGEGVTSITRYAFVGCSLESITIPVSVTTISSDAFGWAETVYYGGSTNDWYQMVGNNTYWFENLSSGQTTTEGSCGADLHYLLDFTDGKMTISGTGAMARWMEDTYVPWYAVRDQIRSVVIEDGLTNITRYAFVGCSLEYITIPASVTTIHDEAFGWAEVVNYAGSTMDWYQLVGGNTSWYGTLNSGSQTAEGSCGENLRYAIDYEANLLRITGTGSMRSDPGQRDEHRGTCVL